MKKFTFLVIVIFSLFFFSCIEYNEKMKLNNDGSGEITFAVGLSENLLNMGDGDKQINDFNEEKIKRDYENKEGINFIKSRSYSKDGNMWIEITLEFESLEKLEKASNDSSSAGMIGKISLAQDDNGNWIFTRGISNDKINSGSDSTVSDPDNMMAMMFSHYKWHYELTLPSKIISTNAKEQDVDYSTNNVKWTFSLASLASDHTMRVVFEKQNSSNIAYVIAGALLLILLSAAAVTLTKKKRTNSV